MNINSLASLLLVSSCLLTTPVLAAAKVAQSINQIKELDLTTKPQIQFTEAGAEYIKVHFKHLQLPKGMAVVVTNPDGSEQYHYGKGLTTAKTVDIKLNQNGETSFSSMSIDGESAIVKLVGRADSTDTTPIKVEIAGYDKGLNQQQLNAAAQDQFNLTGDVNPESICQIDNKRAVACYENSEPEAYKRTQPVVKLLMSGSVCTAWRVGSGNHFFTNNHCIGSQAEANSSEVQFNYQQASCNGSNAPSFKLQVDQVLATDVNLDYTVFTVKNLAQADAFGYLGLDPRRPDLHEPIYIPQHPGGRKKELGIESDNGYCRIDYPTYRNGDSGYQCDTEGGSSGSPVLSQNSNKVIALHHLGGCSSGGNSGARIELIWPQVANVFNNQIPQDSFSNGGNQAPVARINATCDKLACSFDASLSTDTDGSISNYTWNFGDGQTANGVTVNHSYVTTGNYTVSLTVKDNEGASALVSEVINVSDSGNQLQNGVAVTVSGIKDAELLYTFDIPANATSAEVSMSGGSGDADLYIKQGNGVSKTTYDCRPYKNGNSESCPITNPQTGTYSVLVHGYAAFSNVALTASYQTGGNNGGSCSGIAAYDASSVYTTGDIVSFNSKRYQAKWWTQGQTPSNGDTDPWYVWEPLGACL